MTQFEWTIDECEICQKHARIKGPSLTSPVHVTGKVVARAWIQEAHQLTQEERDDLLVQLDQTSMPEILTGMESVEISTCEGFYEEQYLQ